MIPDPRLQPELAGDETLLWQGAPHPARMAQRHAVLSIFGACFALFGLLWMGGAAFISSLIAGVTGWKIIALAPLFGLIFLVAGVAMLFSPLTARRRATHTIYALTNRRIIICETSSARSRRVRSYRGQDLNVIERRDLADGRGDIVFRRDIYHDSEGGSSRSEAGFFGIASAREVETLILKHLKNAP